MISEKVGIKDPQSNFVVVLKNTSPLPPVGRFIIVGQTTPKVRATQTLQRASNQVNRKL